MSSILLLIGNNLQLKANYRIKFEFCPAFIYELLMECGQLPKSLTLFMTKICNSPYPIYDQTKNLITYLPHCSSHSHPKHNILRPFVYGLVNNDEKVASSKQHYPIQD